MRNVRLWRGLLGVDKRTVIEDIEFDQEGADGVQLVVARVRPRSGVSRRCGRCGRRAPWYDRGEGRRRWRGLDWGTMQVVLETDAPRVNCPAHGPTVVAVPWARHHAGHTFGFDDTVAWLAVACSKTAVCELMRIAWRTVGAIVARVWADVDKTVDRFANLRRIGTVTLIEICSGAVDCGAMAMDQRWGVGISGGSVERGNLTPDREALIYFGSPLGRAEPMPSWSKVRGDAAKGRQEPLGMPHRFKAFHRPFALSGGLMRVLGAIVEIPRLPVGHRPHELAVSNPVAGQFVGHQHARHIPQALEQFTEEALGCFGVSPRLHQHVQDVAVLVDCHATGNR